MSDSKRGNPKLNLCREKQQARQEKVKAIEQIILRKNDRGQHIWTIQTVKKQLLQDHGIQVGNGTIADVLKTRFQMRFRKIKPVAFLGNTNRSLVLRCLFAQKLLGILEEGMTIVNIDETWLSQTEFRKYKWCRRGEKNTIPIKSLSERISMIVGLSSVGKVYCSLTQVNTDSNVIMLFINKLSQILNQEDKDWRKKTVLLLDGASYHKSKETRVLIHNLGVKMMLSAPYSYESAPVELFFAYFKRVELNPTNIKLGKKNFKAMVRLVYDRIAAMECHSFPLFWRACVLNAFEYLNFRPL